MSLQGMDWEGQYSSNKCTPSVYRTAANIAGQFINSEMFTMLLSTHMKTAL